MFANTSRIGTTPSSKRKPEKVRSTRRQQELPKKVYLKYVGSMCNKGIHRQNKQAKFAWISWYTHSNWFATQVMMMVILREVYTRVGHCWARTNVEHIYQLLHDESKTGMEIAAQFRCFHFTLIDQDGWWIHRIASSISRHLLHKKRTHCSAPEENQFRGEFSFNLYLIAALVEDRITISTAVQPWLVWHSNPNPFSCTESELFWSRVYRNPSAWFSLSQRTY